MTDYVKSTNFASKDALATGNPLKIVKGTEIDTEFNNIATAVATKADLNSPAFIGTPSAPTAAGGTNTTQVATTAFVTTAVSTSVTNERTAVATLTNKTLTSPTITTPSISSPTITGATITGATVTGGTVTGITDLAITDGGTGASTAADARANLDVPSRSGVGASGTWNINITGTVPTAEVLNATAAASVGAVGTYAMLVPTTAVVTSPGTTRAGSGLRYADATVDSNTAGYLNGGTPSGTWRCMGWTYTWNSDPAVSTATLWLRIS